MYSASVTSTATDVIDELNERAKSAPSRVSRAFAFELRRLEPELLALVSTEPPTADNYYPLPWKSKKQQRFVMAKLRREGNLPYKRTHKLIKSWRVVFKPTQDQVVGDITLENIDPKARFVVGDDTQPMFLKIPWVQGATAVSQMRPIVEDRLIDLWGRVAL